MKNKLFLILIFSGFLHRSGDVLAQTIYLAPNGNDQNIGTAEKPLATLTAARNHIRLLRKQNASNQHAYQVIIRKGEYIMPETFTLSVADNGTETSPLLFKGEDGEMPVFYGGFRINKFEKVSDSLWKTDIAEVRKYGWRFQQLYVNGTRATRAISPNSGFYKPVSVQETVIVKGNGRAPELAVQRIKIPSESEKWIKGLSQEELKDGLITFYHHWDNTKKFIQLYSPSDTSVYISGEGLKPWNPITSASLFVIENVKFALDAPGEWFLERSGTLYYRPRAGETIENVNCMAPLLDKFITISGNDKTGEKVSNIRFENIAFRISGYQIPPSGVEPMQAAASIPASIEIDFASRISFVNCEVSNTGGSGIWFRRACDNGLIEHCYLHDLGAGAVKIGETIRRSNSDEVTHHIRVVNNIARSGGHVFPCAVAMTIFHGRDNELLHNEIADFKYSGVSVGWVWGYTSSPSKRNRVEYNHIHHLGWGVLSDMGGVYTLGASEGTTISNNVIHHIYSLDYGGWGLYTDEGSEGIVMENNLVYNCKSAGFHQHYGKENIIRNNIFANNIKSQLQATRVEPHRSFSFTNNIVYFSAGTLLSSKWSSVNMITDENCYWDAHSRTISFGKINFKEWQKEGKDIHSVVADPAFIDEENFDFRPKNLKVIKKIKFKPFDYNKAGVYGNNEWLQKAAFDATRSAEFDQMVVQNELYPGK